MSAVPTMIRGVLYPSMRAAAEALGVSPQAVYNAAERGTLNNVGLGATAVHSRIPCWFRGKRYVSRTAAARANGITPQAVAMAIAASRQMARQMGA